MAREEGMFGPYELRELLGRGAMGEVWRAFDTRRERAVALKRLGSALAADAEAQERFRREARVTARLSSVHVIPIHDFGEIDGQLFVDMRLVDGGDLARVVDAHPGGLPPHRAVDVVGQIADALDAAHAAELVHRDVKPSNVMLTEHRGRDFCYLVDFGIARPSDATGHGGSGPLTHTNVVLGTTAYMAPEMFAGEAASERSDVYALGCLLVEVLTGERPFAGPDPVAYMAQHVHAVVPVLSATHPWLAALDPVVVRALAKNPANRYPSAGALAAAAQAALGYRGEVGVSRTVVTPAPPRWGDGPAPRRAAPGRRVLAWVGGALVAALLVVGAVVVVDTAGPAALRLPDPVAAPTLVAVGPDGRRAYVAGRGRAGAPPFAVAVLDTATQDVIATVPLGTAPGALAPSPDGRRLLVSERGSDAVPGSTLTTIDTTTATVVARTEVGAAPSGVTLSPDGSRAYVALEGTDAAPGSTVAVVDTATSAVVARVPVGRGPSRLAIDPEGRRVYVSNEGVRFEPGRTVSVVDTDSNAVTATIGVGLTPRGVAVSPDGRLVYVANQGSSTDPGGSISVVDTAAGTVVRTITDGVNGPIDLAVTPDGRAVLVANRGSDSAPGTTVTVLDTGSGTVSGTLTVGPGPFDVAGAPDDRRAYVTTGTQLWQLDVP